MVLILNIVEDYKGQLISKCPFGVVVSTKIPTKNLTISALEFEKWSNHNIKALYNAFEYIK